MGILAVAIYRSFIFRDYVGHMMVGIGDECRAHGAHVLASGHLFLLPHAECLIDRCVGIA